MKSLTMLFIAMTALWNSYINLVCWADYLMSQKLNKTKARYIESLSDKATLLKDCTKNIVFNFKFFYSSKSSGQTFEEWEKDKILADLNNKLKNFSSKTVDELKADGTLEIYGSYPKGSRFACPAVLSGTEAVWCRLRLTGRRRLIGFFSPDEVKQGKTFYVVFLDKNHDFAPSSKD